MNQVSVPCRAILESDPASGAWNMAVDEALLESALAQGMFAVRLYRWDGATLSLGYFQKPEEATGDPRLAGLPRVRRLSGGGAILHHHEWTYSCVLPPGHPIAAVPHLLYETVHRAQGLTAAARLCAAVWRRTGRLRTVDPAISRGPPPARRWLPLARPHA